MDLRSAHGFVQATCGDQVVVPWMKVADRFGLRAVGLMGKAAVPQAYGAGLFFPKCTSLHTCFMRFPLTVIFLDAAGQMLEVRENVTPWQMVKGPKGTRHCAEMAMPMTSRAARGEWEWNRSSGTPA